MTVPRRCPSRPTVIIRRSDLSQVLLICVPDPYTVPAKHCRREANNTRKVYALCPKVKRNSELGRRVRGQLKRFHDGSRDQNFDDQTTLNQKHSVCSPAVV